MSQWKCVACGGVYSDTLPDGLTYYHACAPLPPNAQGVQQERPNKRDETIAVDNRGRPTGIKGAGAGVQPVSATVLVEPAWVTALNNQLARQQAAG